MVHSLETLELTCMSSKRMTVSSTLLLLVLSAQKQEPKSLNLSLRIVGLTFASKSSRTRKMTSHSGGISELDLKLERMVIVPMCILFPKSLQMLSSNMEFREMI